MSGRKEDNISAKILDSIVSGLNDGADQETAAAEIGKRSIPSVCFLTGVPTQSIQC